MGPAILLCPSSSAAHLWGQVSSLKKTRQTDASSSLPHGYPRCSANVHCTGHLIRRPAFFLHPTSSSEKCRKPNYPFAWRRVTAAATGGEVSVEEAAATSGEAPTEQSISSEPSTSNEGTPVAAERKTQSRRTLSRSNSNASKAAVVSPAELIPGAVFPAKVISIQTFGAFVDLGAFTNGLVHISRLSKSYVKKVEDVVQLGQDVQVQVIEVDFQTNRISLMLVEEGKEEAVQEGEAGEKQPQRPSQQQARTPRRDPSKQSSPKKVTMKKGEIATGTVKNIIKSGVFVTLPDGTDGYLPGGQVVFKGPNTNLDAQFQVGQEVTVRVLRVEKGRVNLTMKREMNFDKLNEDVNKDVAEGGTNPFEIAFRRNELIASFLSERDKQKTQGESKDEEAKKVEAVDSGEEVKDTAEEVKPTAEEVKEKVGSQAEASKVEAASLEADAEKLIEEGTDTLKEAVAAVEEKVVEASKDEAVSSEANAEKLTEEGKDTLKEAVTAVEEAIVEQAVAAAEEVANLAEVSANVQTEDVVKEIIASVEENVKGTVEDVAALVEGTILEPAAMEEPVKEGFDTVKEVVAAVEEAVVEQAIAAAEEVTSLAKEVLAKGEATTVEDTVKEVLGALEESAAEKEFDQKDAEEVIGSVAEVVAGKKAEEDNVETPNETEPPVSGEEEEQIVETSKETGSALISSEAELESKTEETQEQSGQAASKDDVKEVKNDSPILVVGAKQQS